jgi:protein-tyrosine phosphatase
MAGNLFPALFYQCYDTYENQQMEQVLFLCTGNYYRSRFAELIFNHHALYAGLHWRSISKGIAVDLGTNNIGPISHYAVKGLEQRGLHCQREDMRYPEQLMEQDLLFAKLTIALYEPEHRPMMARRFFAWTDRIEYWHAPDLQHNIMPPEETLSYIEKSVLTLLNCLATD